jgi:hypothetical protein
MGQVPRFSNVKLCSLDEFIITIHSALRFAISVLLMDISGGPSPSRMIPFAQAGAE